MLRALAIMGVIGSVSLIAAAQFMSIPADTPAMKAVTHALEKVPHALDVSRTLGDVLVFKDRKSIALYIDQDGKPVPQVTTQTATPSDHSGDSVSVPTAAPSTPSAEPASRPSGASLSLTPPSADGPNWGLVTTKEARSFTTAGKSRERVLAGTAVVVLLQKKSSIGECLECTLFPAGPAQPKFVLLKEDVMMMGGTPADLPVEAQQLLVEKAKTLAALNQLELDATSAHRKKNPHYAEYQAARADYLAYWKKVKSLQAARDSDTGSAHVKAEDELRQLKGEDVRVGTAYKAAQEQYESWEKANPLPPVTSNPRYTSLRAQVDALDEKLSAVPPKS